MTYPVYHHLQFLQRAYEAAPDKDKWGWATVQAGDVVLRTNGVAGWCKKVASGREIKIENAIRVFEKHGHYAPRLGEMSIPRAALDNYMTALKAVYASQGVER